jgi:hypothetical protein
VVTPDGNADGAAPAHTQSDPALVKALARAHWWKCLLESSGCVSLGELASAENIDRFDLRKMLRLTLLAPDIVELILNGQQPSDLGLLKLLAVRPVDWEQQCQVIRTRWPRSLSEPRHVRG